MDAARTEPQHLVLADREIRDAVTIDITDLATSNVWRVSTLPATFLVKPGGEVAGMAIGARECNGAEMRALVETLLPAPR